MNIKDKKIVKGTLLVAADAIAAAIHPGIVIAWSLCKSLFGAGMKLREDRALEFIEYIRDNPNIFIAKILATTEFQDGFVFTFENYLRERSIMKRLFIKNILAGFAKSIDIVAFPLERYLNILNQLDENDVEVLKIFTDDSIIKWHNEFYPDHPKIMKEQFNQYPKINAGQTSMILKKIHNDSKFDNVKLVLEILMRLSYIGLIHGEINLRGNMTHGTFVRADFGEEFIKFILV